MGGKKKYINIFGSFTEPFICVEKKWRHKEWNLHYLDELEEMSFTLTSIFLLQDASPTPASATSRLVCESYTCESYTCESYTCIINITSTLSHTPVSPTPVSPTPVSHTPVSPTPASSTSRLLNTFDNVVIHLVRVCVCTSVCQVFRIYWQSHWGIMRKISPMTRKLSQVLAVNWTTV